MNITKTKIVALGSTAAVGLGIAITAASGAYFSASEQMPVSGSTGTLSVMVNGAASNAIGIAFPNLVPGQTQQQVFTVTNTGSVAANVTIGEPITVSSLHGNVQAANYGLLSVGVEGHGGLHSILATPDTISLGELGAGDTGTYTVDVALDSSAGNDWQGASASGTVTVTLDQVH